MGIKERLQKERNKKKELPRLKRLAARLEEFITGHNKLSALVNQVVVPNIQELAKLANQVTSLSKIMANHAIIIYIIKKKLSITDAEFAEAKAHLYHLTEKDPQPSSVQSEEAGSDEDRGPDGQPQLLDAEGVGGDEDGGGGVPVREHDGGSSSDPQDAGPGTPPVGSGEDEAGTIVVMKSAAVGMSEQPTEEGN